MEFYQKNIETENDLLEMVKVHLNSTMSASNASPLALESFVRVIKGISLSYAKIVPLFFNQMLFIFPRLKDVGKAAVLEAFSSCATDLPNLFMELRGRGLSKLLTHQDAQQQFTLLILADLAKGNCLSMEKVEFFLSEPLLDIFINHSNEKCRKAFFVLMIELAKLEIVLKEYGLIRLVRMALLWGMRDEDDEVRTWICNVLQQVLPKNLQDRTCQIMRYGTYHNFQFVSYR